MIHISLMDSTEVATIAACHLIGLMHRKYVFSYRFDIDRLLELVMQERDDSSYSMSLCSASTGALAAILARRPEAVAKLLSTNILEEILEIFWMKSASAKLAFLSVFESLLVHGGQQVFDHFFANHVPGQDTILTFIAEITESHNKADVMRAFSALVGVFGIGKLIHRVADISLMFREAFPDWKIAELREAVPSIGVHLDKIEKYMN